MKKIPLKQKIYLPEYFKGNAAQSFQKESDQRILYWDFDNDLDEKFAGYFKIISQTSERRITLEEAAIEAQKELLECGVF